jgi:hypothetical protein
MCGRFTQQASWEQYYNTLRGFLGPAHQAWKAPDEATTPRYNLAQAPIIIRDGDGLEGLMARWDFVPWFHKGPLEAKKVVRHQYADRDLRDIGGLPRCREEATLPGAQSRLFRMEARRQGQGAVLDQADRYRNRLLRWHLGSMGRRPQGRAGILRVLRYPHLRAEFVGGAAA